MWFTFIGSWFSFLVQCYCLTVYHDLQLPGRLEIILRIRTGPTGRFSYGSGSNWAASCPLGCGCGCKCSICLYPCSRVAQRVLRYGDMEYVMLHLIFIYLTPGEGQPAAYAASDL